MNLIINQRRRNSLSIQYLMQLRGYSIFPGEEILGGVYDQSLYFIIPPFEIDSVSSSDPNSISF